MNYVTLAMGLLLGFLFVGVMVFSILPRLDHIVKKEHGIAEAMVTTRFCCLCIALPFYVFTIWMTVVILFDEQRGLSVLQEICPDDYGCTSNFALGRDNFDKGACTSADCGEANLLARSGSQPLHFPGLGLGQDLSPVEYSVTFECVDFNETSGICNAIEETEGGDGDTCVCVKKGKVNGADACTKYVGCNDDLPSASHEIICDNDGCSEWTLNTDSAKQFSFQDCACLTSQSYNACRNFECDVFTMEYYYPNVFYAGAATVLFILPALVAFWITVKTQASHLGLCASTEMWVYSQEAGIQEETTGEDLRTGGYHQEQKQKTKTRSFSRLDAGVLVMTSATIAFFSFMATQVAGRVGAAFVGLAAGSILAVEFGRLFLFCKNRKKETKKRHRKNNHWQNDPELVRGNN